MASQHRKAFIPSSILLTRQNKLGIFSQEGCIIRRVSDAVKRQKFPRHRVVFVASSSEPEYLFSTTYKGVASILSQYDGRESLPSIEFKQVDPTRVEEFTDKGGVGGGGGSGGSGGGGGGGGDGDGDEEDEHAHLLKDFELLLKENRALSELPSDLREGILAGRILPEELARFFKLEKVPILRSLLTIQGFRSRILADPKFLIKLGTEEFVGVTMKTIAELDARKERFWKEADFVASDIALEICGDFALVWLLAPSILSATSKPSFLSSLPQNAFQKGSFTLPQRLSAFVYKAGQFWCVGFGSAAIGHSITTGLVELKKKLNPDVVPDVELASVLDTSFHWGNFMLVSSNTRYQLVNAIEAWGIDPLLKNSPLLSAAATFVLRTGNTFFGSAQWIWYARLTGLQSSPTDEPSSESSPASASPS